MKSNSQAGYIVSFDALRGIAVIVVMLSHFLGKLWYFSAMGQYGVTLFFVLSGFLITRILLNIRDRYNDSSPKAGVMTSLRVFYLRRTLRIFPLYYATLIIVTLLNIDSAREYWQYYFFYISNYLYPSVTGYNRLSHFWTLAVEEQFYLVWPFIVLFVLPVRRKLFFFLALAFLSLIFRIVLMFEYQGWAGSYLMPASISLFALGAIVLIFKDSVFSKKMLRRLLFLFSCLTAIFFVLPYRTTDVTLIFICAGGGQFFAGIVAAVLLLMVLKDQFNGWFDKVLHNKYLLLIGKISYGIYVVHMFVPGLTGLIMKQTSTVSIKYFFQAVVYMFLSVLIAYLSFFFFEQPINNFKKRFQY